MSKEAKERIPRVAALLSLFIMGLGQLYNGQHRRAVVFYALEIFPISVVAIVPTLLFSFPGIVILYVWVMIYVLVKIFSIVDAFIYARRIHTLELRRYNRWYVYLSMLISTIAYQIALGVPGKSYSLPTESMLPTLLVGDHLFVDKNAYHDRAPGRGDVVVFKLPRNNQFEYITRIVGLPGDRIQMLKGILHINGQPVPREPIPDYLHKDRYGNVLRFPQFRESLPNGVIYETQDRDPRSRLDNTRVYKVPAGHYFMMGDNRDNSQDSRITSAVGFVPAENLVGRAEILFFSQNGTASWWQIWRWPQAIRFSRIGNKIH